MVKEFADRLEAVMLATKVAKKKTMDAQTAVMGLCFLPQDPVAAAALHDAVSKIVKESVELREYAEALNDKLISDIKEKLGQ